MAKKTKTKTQEQTQQQQNVLSQNQSISDFFNQQFGGGQQSATSGVSGDFLPFIMNAANNAEQLFEGQSGRTPPPFETVAGFSPDTLQSFDLTRQLVNQGSPALASATGAVSDIAGGLPNQGINLLNPIAQGGANPFLEQTFNQAADVVSDRVNSQFAGSGRTGSVANQQVLQRGLNDLATNIFGGAFENEQNRRLAAAQGIGSLENQGRSLQLGAAGLAPTLNRERFFAPAQLGLIGGQQEALQERIIQDQIDRFNFPFENQRQATFDLTNLISQLAPSFTRSTQAGQTSFGGQSGGQSAQSRADISELLNRNTTATTTQKRPLLDTLLGVGLLGAGLFGGGGGGLGGAGSGLLGAGAAGGAIAPTGTVALNPNLFGGFSF